MFTSADSVRYVGRKTPKDLTIGYTALKNLTRDQWYGMSDAALQPGRLLATGDIGAPERRREGDDNPSPESLRAKRLAYFS